MWPEDVTKADLRIEYYRGSGKGGQHRNKRDTAARITHIPTGISATAEDSKSQATNKKNAFIKLCKQLIPIMKAAAQPEVEEFRSDKVIRTYHEKRGTVKDHRTGKIGEYNDVLDGNIDCLKE